MTSEQEVLHYSFEQLLDATKGLVFACPFDFYHAYEQGTENPILLFITRYYELLQKHHVKYIFISDYDYEISKTVNFQFLPIADENQMAMHINIFLNKIGLKLLGTEVPKKTLFGNEDDDERIPAYNTEATAIVLNHMEKEPKAKFLWFVNTKHVFASPHIHAKSPFPLLNLELYSVLHFDYNNLSASSDLFEERIEYNAAPGLIFEFGRLTVFKKAQSERNIINRASLGVKEVKELEIKDEMQVLLENTYLQEQRINKLIKVLSELSDIIQ